MTIWKIYYTNQAQKDAKKLKKSNLKEKAMKVLDIISQDPFTSPPPYEKLVGDLFGCYFRRINIQHRLVYSLHKEEKSIKVIRMWSHYE